jgi:membrane associated rhomboid family serine protease
VIPLRDDVPSRTVPFVNYALIAANAAMFLVEVGMGAELEGFFQRAAVIPALYTGGDGALSGFEVIGTSLDPGLGGRVLTAMFLHGGIAHLLGNMLYLWIFGDNVEDRMGHLRYLIFYLSCGWVASYAHVWASPTSTLPSLGASGAIGGVLGAYITLYPHARVVTLIPLGIFIQLVSIPAVFLLGFWFLQQFVLGTTSLGLPDTQSGGVAWWAHIGGFAAGFVLVWLFQKRDRRPEARDAWWQEKRWREAPGRRRGW